MGDININMLSDPNSPHLKHYNLILISNGFTSCITKLTRITKHSQTSIDHLITNVDGTIITPSLLPYSISDHLPIFCIASSAKHKNPFENSIHYYRNVKNFNGDVYLDDLYDTLTHNRTCRGGREGNCQISKIWEKLKFFGQWEENIWAKP